MTANGHDRQQRDEGRVGEGAAHLVRRLEDDCRRRRVDRPPRDARRRRRGHVLGADDGVVDDDREGDREAGERDRVEGLPEQIEHERRRHQREPGSSRARRATVRHSNSRAARTSTRSSAADQRAPGRGCRWRRRCTSPAGTPTCRSACRAGPGRRFSSASSTPSVTSSVLAPGNFSTTSSRPSPSPTTASPISGWWSLDDLGHIGQAQPAARALDGDLAELGRARDLARGRCGPAAVAAASR